MTDAPVLRVEELSKSFGTQRVVNELSFHAAPGEILGFVGPNGAGKSTTLRCLMGLVFPDQGRIEIAGIDALRSSVAARAEVGYLPGEASLYRNMRGQEAIDFGLAFHRKIDTGVLDYCAQEFQLPLGNKTGAYSSGMKQQLALTIALAPDVPLYVLDEPDKALDPSHRRQLRILLRRLRDRGKALVISSHHLSELEETADRLVFLRGGSFVDDDVVREARERISDRIRVRFDAPPDAEVLSSFAHESDGRRWSFQPRDGEHPDQLRTRLEEIGATSFKTGQPSLEELYEELYLEEPAS